MRFLFAGGDGDQSYFGESFLAERTEEEWFPRVISGCGPAYWLKILTGPHKGEYLAITSRQTASLEEQRRRGNYISVVVHSVRNPGSTFVPSGDNLTPIGMAAIQVVKA